MSSTICTNCGGSAELQDGSLHCPFCGAVISDTLPPKAQKKLDKAFLLLREERFDEAKKAFEAVIQKYPECAEAYWGRLRARYHIKYVTTADGKAVPTCPTRSGANILEDADYKKAMENASEEYKAFLQKEAEAVKKFCTDNIFSKNAAFKFTLGDIDPTDEYHVKPEKSKKPIILSASLSFVLIVTLSVCFAMGLFHRHKPGAAATCTNAQICTKCEEVLAPAKGHKPGAEANCTEAQSCTVCNATLVAALGHRPGEGATCTEAQTCGVCNEVLVIALGHKPGAEATCTEAQTCGVCNEVLVVALGHKPGAEATCTEVQNCSVCNAELVEALGHTYGGWITVNPATKTEDGLREQHCNRCGYINSEVILAIGSEGLKYNLNGDDTYSVTGIGTCTDTEVVIPAVYNGKPVTSIGAYAFSGRKGLTSIVIPDGVTSIGDRAFSGCSSLTGISIPDSVTSIGSYAFNGCTGLTSITIPEGVTSIGSSAFWGCTGLTSVTIGNGVKSIGDDAFRYCSSLTSISIPDSVTSIGDYAFWHCSSLTSITIPEGVTSIGSYAFQGCAGLTSIIIPDSVTSIGNSAFYGCTGLTSVTIGNGVTSIGSSAFWGCTGLTSITIPEGVTSIGGSAFSGCTGLTSISIPSGVTSIGDWAFSSCSSLTSITFTGTTAQWSAISFGSYWNSSTGAYTVICTDGTVSKN